MNDLQVGGVDKVYGRNISCINGNAAVMISPHAMMNGSVDVDTITAVNTGIAVRIGNGFVSSKYTKPDLVPGIFESVNIRNVVATFDTTAQLKEKHYKYIPVYREKYSGDDDYARYLATHELQRMGPAAGAKLPAILQLLDDPRDAVRMRGAMILGALGSKYGRQCEQPLLAALADKGYEELPSLRTARAGSSTGSGTAVSTIQGCGKTLDSRSWRSPGSHSTSSASLAMLTTSSPVAVSTTTSRTVYPASQTRAAIRAPSLETRWSRTPPAPPGGEVP